MLSFGFKYLSLRSKVSAMTDAALRPRPDLVWHRGSKKRNDVQFLLIASATHRIGACLTLSSNLPCYETALTHVISLSNWSSSHRSERLCSVVSRTKMGLTLLVSVHFARLDGRYGRMPLASIIHNYSPLQDLWLEALKCRFDTEMKACIIGC